MEYAPRRCMTDEARKILTWGVRDTSKSSLSTRGGTFYIQKAPGWSMTKPGAPSCSSAEPNGSEAVCGLVLATEDVADRFAFAP